MDTGLPFPSLPAFVQSLLDSQNLLNLEGLIDAMNLGEDWAAKNVKFAGQSYPEVQISPKYAWELSTRTRQTRIGCEYDPKIHVTRYRRHRERDPREVRNLSSSPLCHIAFYFKVISGALITSTSNV